MRQEEEDDLMPTAMSPDQLCDKSPHSQLQLLWLNFKVASRHLVRVSNFEAQTEAELNPMHVVQNDETLSSIARARFLRSISRTRADSVTLTWLLVPSTSSLQVIRSGVSGYGAGATQDQSGFTCKPAMWRLHCTAATVPTPTVLYTPR